MTTQEAIGIVTNTTDPGVGAQYHDEYLTALSIVVRASEENEKNAEDADAWRGLSHG